MTAKIKQVTAAPADDVPDQKRTRPESVEKEIKPAIYSTKSSDDLWRLLTLMAEWNADSVERPRSLWIGLILSVTKAFGVSVETSGWCLSRRDVFKTTSALIDDFPHLASFPKPSPDRMDGPVQTNKSIADGLTLYGIIWLSVLRSVCATIPPSESYISRRLQALSRTFGANKGFGIGSGLNLALISSICEAFSDDPSPLTSLISIILKDAYKIILPIKVKDGLQKLTDFSRGLGLRGVIMVKNVADFLCRTSWKNHILVQHELKNFAELERSFSRLGDPDFIYGGMTLRAKVLTTGLYDKFPILLSVGKMVAQNEADTMVNYARTDRPLTKMQEAVVQRIIELLEARPDKMSVLAGGLSRDLEATRNAEAIAEPPSDEASQKGLSGLELYTLD